MDVADANLRVAQESVLLFPRPAYDILLYAELGVKDSILDVCVHVLLKHLVDRDSRIVATLHAVADVLKDTELVSHSRTEVDDTAFLIDAKGGVGVSRLRIQSVPSADVVIEIPIAIAAVSKLTVELAVAVDVDALLGSRDAVVVDGRVLRLEYRSVLVEEDAAVVIL